jgi:hypothetical protein
MTLRFGFSRLTALVAFATLILLSIGGRAVADPDLNPFNMLLGSWGGTGEYLLQDGKKERVKCNAYYTGGGSQLGMVIRCASEDNKIEIRSKLSKDGSRITGSWEERTYNASGNASGSASGDRISLQITGGVSGTMQVSCTKSRQSVAISTQGAALKSVSITLGRS